MTTSRAVRFIRAADYLKASRHPSPAPSTAVDTRRPEAKVSRCTVCGQWTWEGRCTLHPTARQDVY